MRPTGEGRRFILAALLISLAAYNTGNNLIFLILAMMLSMLAVSYAALVFNLRGIRIKAFVGRPVFAGQEAALDVTVENTKGRLPSYSLGIGLPEGIEGQGFAAMAPPSSGAEVRVRARFEKRGVYRLGEFWVESGFPFILFRRSVTVRAEGEIIVYPRLVHVEPFEGYSSGMDGTSAVRPGGSDDLLAIREMRPGDEPGAIDWKASAKVRKLMVKEMSEYEPRTATIVLDDGGWYDPAYFERAVSYAASAAAELIERGYYVGLLSCSKRLPLGSGTEQLYRVLDVLAEIQESGSMDVHSANEINGLGVLVLKSPSSGLMALAPECRRVVYASAL